LVCWSGTGQGANPALKSLADSGVKVFRSRLRRGCRWGLPDTAMVVQGWRQLARSQTLVFGKTLHCNAHRLILPLKKRMILITPYRPMEMWTEGERDSKNLNSFESIIVQGRAFEDDLRRLGYGGKTFNLPYLPPEVQGVNGWPAGSQLQLGYLGRLVETR